MVEPGLIKLALIDFEQGGLDVHRGTNEKLYEEGTSLAWGGPPLNVGLMARWGELVSKVHYFTIARVLFHDMVLVRMRPPCTLPGAQGHGI